MMKLYGIPISHNVNKIRYILNYLKLPFELISVNPLEGQNKTPEFERLSPTQKIPAFEDNGFMLFESNAIVRYIAKKQSSSLYPQDIKKAAIIDAWTDFSTIHVGHAMGRILANRVFAPMRNQEPDRSSLAFGLEMMDKYLPVLNKQLSKNKFIAGSEITIADFVLLSILDACEMVQVSLSSYRELTMWRNNLKSQDFYQKCYKDYTSFVQEIMSAKAAV